VGWKRLWRRGGTQAAEKHMVVERARMWAGKEATPGNDISCREGAQRMREGVRSAWEGGSGERDGGLGEGWVSG
jgi:hypothetical protein